MRRFQPNASLVDRAVRALLMPVLIYLGFVHPGIVGNRLVAYLLGAVGLLNLLVVCCGWCPIYALTGVCTVKKQ